MTAKEILIQANLQDSHWGQRIIAAEERGNFTLEDSYDSGDWTTCACGTQDPRIPRGVRGTPLDEVLLDGGLVFSKLIDVYEDGSNWEFDFVEAAKTLITIEKRAAEIIVELESNPA